MDNHYSMKLKSKTGIHECDIYWYDMDCNYEVKDGCNCVFDEDLSYADALYISDIWGVFSVDGLSGGAFIFYEEDGNVDCIKLNLWENDEKTKQTFDENYWWYPEENNDRLLDDMRNDIEEWRRNLRKDV